MLVVPLGIPTVERLEVRPRGAEGDLLVDHRLAVRRPVRRAHVGALERDPAGGVGEPLIAAALDQIADLVRADILGRDLEAGAGGMLDPLAARHVDRDDLRADPADPFRPARAPRRLGGQLVEDDALAVRRPFGRAEAIARLGRDLAQAGAVRLDDVDAEFLGMLPAVAVVMPAPFGVAIAGEGDPLAVGRPGWPEIAIGLAVRALDGADAGQLAGAARGDIERPDVGAIAVARRDEGERAAIGGQDTGIVHRRAGDERGDTAAVGLGAKHVGLAVAVALRGEHHPVALGGEGRVIFISGIAEELALVRPVDVGDVEFGHRGRDPVHIHHAPLAHRRCGGARERRLRQQGSRGNGAKEVSAMHHSLPIPVTARPCRP